MNIKRAMINSILGIIVFNAISLVAALIRQTPFQFDVLFNLVTPIVAGIASGLARTPKERANRL